MMSRFDASDDLEFNPYAAPETDSKAPIRHYRVVFWRLTYAECWRIRAKPVSLRPLRALQGASGSGRDGFGRDLPGGA